MSAAMIRQAAIRFPKELLHWTRCTSNPSFSSATTSSSNCPFQLVNKQYLTNPEFTGTLPKVDRFNYVDSDIKFLNYHSGKLATTFCSDYDHCFAMNGVPGQELMHIYFPSLVTSDKFNQSFVEESMDFFEHKYPLTPRLKELYNEATVEFVRDCSRIIGTRDYMSQDLRNTYHISFGLLILFHDVAETLTLIEDPEPLRAFRDNNSRIVHDRQDEVPRIDLSALPSFPLYLLEHALLFEDYYADLQHRIKRYAGIKVSQLYARAWDCYMDGVLKEPDMLKTAMNGRLKMYTKDEILAARSCSIGATVTNSVAHTDYCASYLKDGDAMIDIAENASCSDSEFNTYWKDKLANEKAGRIVALNTMDWFKQVENLSEHDALVACLDNRNRILNAMIVTMPLIQPNHLLRYQRAVEEVLLRNDYFLVGGINGPNNRYGWYPAFKTEEEKNMKPGISESSSGQENP